MRVIIQPDYGALSQWAAHYVASKINRANPTAENPFVPGLPAGSSPLGMYKSLIELNRKGLVSFKHVITFNMDEYAGLPENHPESYRSFMWNNFFSHINVNPEHVNIPNGNATDTIIANSRFFGNDPEKVPQTALTVGVGTIMFAREVLILANGHSKARALAQGVEGPVSQMWTITALQLHPKGIIVCDEAATDELKVGTYKYFKDIEKNNLNYKSLL